MRRSWGCIRDILLALEHSERSVPGWQEDFFNHQIHILAQGGFIEVSPPTDTTEPTACLAKDLTWKGHELLAMVGDQRAWDFITTFARNSGCEITLDLIEALHFHGIRLKAGR